MDSKLAKLAEEFRSTSSTKDKVEIRHEAQASVGRNPFSPRALLEWKAEAFSVWCVTYIPHLIPEVEEWQLPTLDSVFTCPRILIMWPAVTGKTTMFSVALPLFRELGNPNLEGLGVFKDDDDAKSTLKAIRNEMTDNEKLIEDYGQLRPSPGDRTRKWTEHRVDFAQRTRRGKQSSLMYLPYGSQVLGKRSNWRFADDIVTQKVAMSQALNLRQQQWFTVDFETGPYKPDDQAGYIEGHDQIIVQMTRMTSEDLGHYLETRISEEAAARNPRARKFKSIVVDLLDEANERVVVPRYGNWEDAMALEAEMGPEAFAMRMRNKVVSDKTAKVKRVYIEGGEFNNVTYPGCWKRDLAFDEAIRPGMTVAIGYDPQSGSKTRHAAEAGIVMLGNTADNTWKPRLLDYARGKMEILGDTDPDSQVMRILGMAQRCNAKGITPMVALESNNVQRALRVGILEAAQRHGVAIRCNPVYTGDNKWDERTGLEQSLIDFENGWLEIPGALPSDEAYFRGFVDAMCAYGVSAFIDIPIAYWKARQYLWTQRGQRDARPQVIHLDQHTPARVGHRLARMGRLQGLVIRDAYVHQQEAHDGQRVG